MSCLLQSLDFKGLFGTDEPSRLSQSSQTLSAVSLDAAVQLPPPVTPYGPGYGGVAAITFHSQSLSCFVFSLSDSDKQQTNKTPCLSFCLKCSDLYRYSTVPSVITARMVIAWLGHARPINSNQSKIYDNIKIYLRQFRNLIRHFSQVLEQCDEATNDKWTFKEQR